MSKVTECPGQVPGLGFKDKAAAEATLKKLEGRDPRYQSSTVKTLLKFAKDALINTNDEKKQSDIKEAMRVLEKFLEDYDKQSLGKQNNPYLSLGVVRTCLWLAEQRNLNLDHQRSFIEAYAQVDGDYKRLRTLTEASSGNTWDIVRNTALKELKEKYAQCELFDETLEPTDAHLQMLVWAYSPEHSKIKKIIPESKADRKRRKSSRKEKKSKSKKKKDS